MVTKIMPSLIFTFSNALPEKIGRMNTALSPSPSISVTSEIKPDCNLLATFGDKSLPSAVCPKITASGFSFSTTAMNAWL
jgi:hypothetical protein